MPIPDNRILGSKYRLVRQIDEGGMASVWLAEHLSLHSPVAVKLLTQEIAESEEGVQRFLREARSAASLRSPHVVQILDYGVDGVTPYIVMELLDGESLAERLKRLQRLSPRDTELVLRHVARAVTRAHDAGIVHRDLKPPNIFIIRNDDEELVKLLDFGIAKAAVDALGSSIASNTRTGAFLGTPYYVSPEQAEGVKTLDHRTDIWAMGVIAFECLTGQQPFTGDTFGSLVLSICSRPLPVPSQHGPVPPGFDAWFARACARHVDERFQSAREAAAALRPILTAEATEAAPPTLYSESTPPASHAEVALSLPPLAASVAAGAPSSLPAPQLAITTGVVSSSATTHRQPVRQNARLLGLAGLVGLVVLALGLGARLLGGNRALADAEPAASRDGFSPLAPVRRPEPEPQAPSAGAAPPAAPGPRPAVGGPAGQVTVRPVAPLAEATPPVPPATGAGGSAPTGVARTMGPIVAPVTSLPAVVAAKPAPARVKPTKARPRPVPAAAAKPAAPKPTSGDEKVEPSAPQQTKPAGKHGVNLGI